MKTARFCMLWAGLWCFTLTPSVLANDVITLNSGEAIAGSITSENDTQLVIEVSNARQPIFTAKTVSKSEILSIQRETAEAKKERLAYEAVQPYRPNPDQEFTLAQYDAGLALCQKFLNAYPNGEHVGAVQLQQAQLEKEKAQVEKGLVKFSSRWMTARQKAAEHDLRVILYEVQRLQLDLANLQDLRNRVHTDIADDQSEAFTAKAAQSAAADHHDQGSRAEAEQNHAFYAERIKQNHEFLSSIDSKISQMQSDLAVALREYGAAKAERDKLVAGSP